MELLSDIKSAYMGVCVSPQLQALRSITCLKKPSLIANANIKTADQIIVI